MSHEYRSTSLDSLAGLLPDSSLVMLRAETRSRKMRFRIWKQKVMLVTRIRQQERSLAKAIHEVQVEMGQV